MSKRKFIHFLRDILIGSEKIIFLIENKPFDKFVQDWVIVDATVRNLEVIGEPVKKIPDEVKQKYPHIEWKKIAGLRDILIHAYFGINYNILWDIVKNKISEMKNEINKIIEQEGGTK